MKICDELQILIFINGIKEKLSCWAAKESRQPSLFDGLVHLAKRSQLRKKKETLPRRADQNLGVAPNRSVLCRNFWYPQLRQPRSLPTCTIWVYHLAPYLQQEDVEEIRWERCHVFRLKTWTEFDFWGPLRRLWTNSNGSGKKSALRGCFTVFQKPERGWLGWWKVRSQATVFDTYIYTWWPSV